LFKYNVNGDILKIQGIEGLWKLLDEDKKLKEYLEFRILEYSKHIKENNFYFDI
jgi:hypothetical protein